MYAGVALRLTPLKGRARYSYKTIGRLHQVRASGLACAYYYGLAVTYTARCPSQCASDDGCWSILRMQSAKRSQAVALVKVNAHLFFDPVLIDG